MQPAIRVDGISKEYALNLARQRGYQTLGETLTNAFRNPFRGVKDLVRRGIDRNRPRESFFALNNVSFDIPSGGVVGIIGRNGAGKSTLLKILSRITEPSSGRIELRGRLGSLLEVGTGFHPELTGRENVYLNGAILGMKRSEITRKFDSIVAFSEIEDFLDTPVKRYSSGMYVRLAFAVASHLEPEILLMDEVLAVGDFAFQKKCLQKLEETGNLGGTVLLVSHDMQAVTRLCQRAILLENGKVAQDGHASDVVRTYLTVGAGSMAQRNWDNINTAPGDDLVRLKSVRARTSSGPVERIDVIDPICLEMDYWILQTCDRPLPGFHFFNENGLRLFASVDVHDAAWKGRRLEPGLYRSMCQVPGNLFAEGQISVLAALSSPGVVHVREANAVSFQVVDQTEFSARGGSTAGWPGVVRPLLSWSSEQTEAVVRDQNGSRIDNLTAI